MMQVFKRMNIRFAGICVLLAVVAFVFFPRHRIVTNEAADNPNHCPFYITMQSMLVNYPLLSTDKANYRFIQNQMLRFENESARMNNKIAAGYRDQYFQILNRYNATSIKSITDESLVINVAASAASVVDGFYLNDKLFCQNPLYFADNDHTRRILKFNFAGIYDMLPEKYMRTLSVMPYDSQIGVFSGVFVNNGSTTLTTQFITGMPLLTALYVLPEHNFAEIGSYSAVVPWNYFRPAVILSPRTRKAMDVAGIDVFSFSKSNAEWESVATIPDISSFATGVYPMFGSDVQSYVNLRSYGMAYLANQVKYVDPHQIRPYEKTIKNYFGNIYKRQPEKFLAASSYLYEMLTNLQHKGDIILEAKQPQNVINENDNQPAGNVEIAGIVGERALFTTKCLRDQCTFVVNISDAPGWRAFVNGKPTKISRANFAFMSVAVPEGASSVWLIYYPYSESISYLVSIFALIGILIMGYNRKKT